jgi:hypothetical protein
MKAKEILIPAITREIEFCAYNVRTMEAILENENRSALGTLTESVALRANQDTDKLLRAVEGRVSEALAGIIRLRWVNTNRAENWWSWGKLYMPRGPMRRSMGQTGIMLAESPTPLRLIGWIWPRLGGMDGRRELVHVCRRKLKAVCLAHENPRRYPDWTEDDGIVWLDEQLTLRSSFDDVVLTVSREAKTFFRIAKPILRKLAYG